MKSKLIIISTIVAVMILCLAANVFALGIAPAQTYLSNSQETQEFRGIIVNNDLIDGAATLTAQTSSPFITVEFSQTEFELSSDQNEYFFAYTITVDSSSDSNLEGRIGEIVLTGLQDVGQVSAQLELTSPIYLNSKSQTNTANTKFESEIIEEDGAQEAIAQNNAQNKESKENSFLESFRNKDQNTNNQIREIRSISPARATIAIVILLVIVITSIVTISFTRSKEL